MKQRRFRAWKYEIVKSGQGSGERNGDADVGNHERSAQSGEEEDKSYDASPEIRVLSFLERRTEIGSTCSPYFVYAVPGTEVVILGEVFSKSVGNLAIMYMVGQDISTASRTAA